MTVRSVGSSPALGVSEYGVNGNIEDFQSFVVGSNPATRIEDIVYLEFTHPSKVSEA